jgi:hypothetical protein
MEPNETDRYAKRRSPPLARSAAILVAVLAVACVALVVGGLSLPFRSAHATAPGSTQSATSGTASPLPLASERPVGYFPDHYENAATKIEEPPPTF